MIAYEKLTAWDRVYIARHKDRPKAFDYIKALFHIYIMVFLYTIRFLFF